MLILTAFSKICRPTSPRWIEINIYWSWSKTTVEKRGTGRNTGKGWRTAGERRREGGGKELETADWENYYSLSRSCPVVFAPLPLTAGRAEGLSPE